MKLLVDQGERVRHRLETQVMELQDKLKQAQGPEPAKEALMKVGAGWLPLPLLPVIWSTFKSAHSHFPQRMGSR